MEHNGGDKHGVGIERNRGTGVRVTYQGNEAKGRSRWQSAVAGSNMMLRPSALSGCNVALRSSIVMD